MAEEVIYYESHITISPVLDEERLTELREIASRFGFRVADLLMKKRDVDTPQRSMYDTFLSTRVNNNKPGARDKCLGHTLLCCTALRDKGFDVWRYKIEAVIIDSTHHNDEFNLISKNTPNWSYGRVSSN